MSSWAVGDPAMVVDFRQLYCPGGPQNKPKLGPKATKAFYPDDPSNVYHSYMGIREFQILHAGTNTLTYTTCTLTSGCTRPTMIPAVTGQPDDPRAVLTRWNTPSTAAGTRTKQWATRYSTATSIRISPRVCGRCGGFTMSSKQAPSSTPQPGGQPQAGTGRFPMAK